MAPEFSTITKEIARLNTWLLHAVHFLLLKDTFLQKTTSCTKFETLSQKIDFPLIYCQDYKC